MSELRSLPSVDKLSQSPLVSKLIVDYGRRITLDAVRLTLDKVRSEFKKTHCIPDQEDIILRIESMLKIWTRLSLQPVINATGVIVHTNLGRAPLSISSLQAIHEVSNGYSNLEYDLTLGSRGSRLSHVVSLLTQITGAEDALVVNNNASAVLLTLSRLARRRRVLISRSQLIEIGGGFRIPDVMKQSGAKLVEIGTTNRVHLRDYEKALHEQPIYLVMRAHRSNFQIVGFTKEPKLEEITSIAHNNGVPVLDDLGSGSLLDTSRFGLAREPMVQDSLNAGADLVSFSGDKLLGGPQAGIIVGRADLILMLKKHPLARAVRADKLCLAALGATLLHYLKGEAVREIPIWRMISANVDKLHERANKWMDLIGEGDVVTGESTVGGGSLPGECQPSFLYSLKVSHPDRFLSRLRNSTPPVIARIKEERVVFDPRTVLPEQDNVLIEIIRQTTHSGD
ncbi:MAG: L-seryl-tRNA(Sec) selenium transferase [Anaerolineales bacterium]|jgi:L-seryl-tRNA(Ser) seleniumtransferase